MNPERDQSMDWFGEPWPSAARRAEVCANDEYRQPIPIGIPCIVCGGKFTPESQGVLIPMLTELDSWAAYHLACFIAMIHGKKGHHR